MGIEIPKAYQTFLKCVNNGKKLLVTITGIEDKTVFGHFKYNDNGVKYDFRIAVIRCNPGLLENIKTQYSVEIKGTSGSNSGASFCGILQRRKRKKIFHTRE